MYLPCSDCGLPHDEAQWPYLKSLCRTCFRKWLDSTEERKARKKSEEVAA